MSEAPPFPIDPPPGVVKTESNRVIEGRFSHTDKIRFESNRAQKIGGWARRSTDATLGVPRTMHAWRDLDSKEYLSAATAKRLYVYDVNFVQHNITPLDATGSLSDPFTTTDGSNRVSVAHSAHGRSIGDVVIFPSGSGPVGGLTISGMYIIVERTSANVYVIEAASAAMSDDSGGGTVAYQYEVGAATEHGALGFGYGVGPYGELTYGTPRLESTITIEARIWSLDHWGQNLLASFNGGTLYQWEPSSSFDRAEAVNNAPTDIRHVYVIPERYVIALCDDLTIKWCSQNDLETWTAALSNTAGERKVTIGTKLIGGRAVGPGISLIWTDSACYIHQWRSDALVFNTRLAGDACGLISPSASISANGIAYWMGHDSFWLYNGAVQELPNVDSIKRYVFDALRREYAFECCAIFNARFNEIWWFYVATGQQEPGLYVIYHIDQKCFSVGTLTRTAATYFTHGDTRPYMASDDGHIYLHEETNDADGVAMEASVTLAPYALENGGKIIEIQGLEPDFHEQSGNLSVTLIGYDRPRNSPIDTQTKVIPDTESYTDFRVAGRYVGMTIVSNSLGGFFRMGKPTVETQPNGERR